MRQPKPKQKAATPAKPLPAAPPPVGAEDDTPMTVMQVCLMLNISPVSLWRGVEKGDLPKPFYPTPHRPRWTLGELRAARERMRMRPSEAKAAIRAAKLVRDAAAPLDIKGSVQHPE